MRKTRCAIASLELGYKTDKNGKPIERGIGAPGHETEAHYAALEKYEGKAAADAARTRSKAATGVNAMQPAPDMAVQFARTIAASDAEHHFLETSISAIQRQMEISGAAHKDSAAPFNDRVIQFVRDVRQADIAHFRRCLAATKRTGANPSFYEIPAAPPRRQAGAGRPHYERRGGCRMATDDKGPNIMITMNPTTRSNRKARRRHSVGADLFVGRSRGAQKQPWPNSRRKRPRLSGSLAEVAAWRRQTEADRERARLEIEAAAAEHARKMEQERQAFADESARHAAEAKSRRDQINELHAKASADAKAAADLKADIARRIALVTARLNKIKYVDPTDASSQNLELAAALLAIIADPKSAKEHLDKIHAATEDLNNARQGRTQCHRGRIGLAPARACRG